MLLVRSCCWICEHFDYGFECNDETVTYRCFFYCKLTKDEIFYEDAFSSCCEEFKLKKDLAPKHKAGTDYLIYYCLEECDERPCVLIYPKDVDTSPKRCVIGHSPAKWALLEEIKTVKRGVSNGLSENESS